MGQGESERRIRGGGLNIENIEADNVAKVHCDCMIARAESDEVVTVNAPPPRRQCRRMHAMT